MPHMKALVIILAFALTGCETLPIKGKLCYQTPQGEVCAESDGTALFLSGTVKSTKGFAK